MSAIHLFKTIIIYDNKGCELEFQTRNLLKQIELVFDNDAHTACSTFNHTHCGFYASVFRSGILVSAISRTLSRLTVATLLRFGSPEPDSIPATFLRRTAAGEVLVMKVNERSSNTVISTGMIRPA